MPIAPIRQSGVATQAAVDTGTAPTATISGVVAGNCLIAVVAAYRLSTTGDLISGYTTTISGSPANTWTLAARSAITSAGGHRTEITVWVAPNCAAGTTVGRPAIANADTSVWHHFDEWPDLPTSTPVDKVATATAAGSVATVTAGPTAALVQAASLQISAVCDRFNFSWNGSGDGAGAPPTGHTILRGTTSNAILAAQSSYRELSSTAGVSAAWTRPTDPGWHGTAAVTVTLRIVTLVRRLRIGNLGGLPIAGTTGWAAWGWTADPKDIRAHYYEGADVSVSAGQILLLNPPAGIVVDQQGQAIAQNATLTTGLVPWTCEAV
jgi:hypothetical protein